MRENHKVISDIEYLKSKVVKTLENSLKNKIKNYYNILAKLNEQAKTNDAKKEIVLTKICKGHYKLGLKFAFDSLKENALVLEKQNTLKQKVVDRFIRQVYVKVIVVFNKLRQHSNASVSSENHKFNILKKII